MPASDHAVERTGDVLGRVGPLAADDARQVGDGGGGELVPPLGELAHRGDEPLAGRLVAGHGRGGDRLRVQVELPADLVNEFLGTRVANRVLAAGEDREQPLVAENVPRVDERTAVDPAAEQVFDLAQ